jgi:hypothetical protein
MRMHWRNTLCVLSLVLLALGCATAPAPAPTAAVEQTRVESAPSTSSLSKLPPLLDRDLFFGDPEISGAQISPDGRYISFIKPYRGVRNVWVKAINEPFDAARAVTADMKRPVGNYFWSEDGRYILYVQDKGGNENFHVYAVDPAASADPST